MKTIYKEVYVVDVLNDKIKHIFDDINIAEKYRNEQISVGRGVSDIYTEFMPFAVEETDLVKENKQLKEKIGEYEKALNGELFINFKLPMEHTKLKRELNELKEQLTIIEKALELACQKLTYYEIENKESSHFSQFWYDSFIEQAKESLE